MLEIAVAVARAGDPAGGRCPCAAGAAGAAQQLGVTDFEVRVGIHTRPVLVGGGAEAERRQQAALYWITVFATTWSSAT